MMGDGDVDDRTLGIAGGEIAGIGLDPKTHGLADVFQPRIPQQRAGQQSGFRQHLEAVADAQDVAAALCMGLDGLDHRRLRRDGPAAQVVAVGKAAGHADDIDILREGAVLVPYHVDLRTRRLEGDRKITVTVRSGKDDDRGPHQPSSTV